MSTFVVDWRNGSVPFLPGAVPQLKPHAVSAHHAVLEGEVVADCGRDVLGELVAHELADERGFAHRSAAHEAHLDKLVDLLGILLENFE